jgi:hypothetical protein
MYWEEHIEIIKKSFSQKEFSIPFTDWVTIMKKIENGFIIKVNSTDHFSNWADNIKHKIEVAVIHSNDLKTSLMYLSDAANYWVIIPLGPGPTAQQCVYDCNLRSLLELVQLCNRSPVCNGSFFIVEKRYSWFAYFCVGNENNCISIFKSGESITPFDKLQDHPDRIRT